MKKYFLLTCLIFTISCKKQEKATKKPQERTSVPHKKSIIQVKIEGYYRKDDNIVLFYENEEGKGFNDSLKLSKNVKGSKEKQIVIIKLPEDENLLDFSLHISNRLDQEISINKFTITDGFDTIEIKKDSLFNYIKPNKYIEVKDGGNFDLITLDIDGILTYNPMFKCHTILKNKLKDI